MSSESTLDASDARVVAGTPGGIAKRRGPALSDIAYLRQHGFTSLAADLETLLARASESPAHANVDMPAVAGRQ